MSIAVSTAGSIIAFLRLEATLDVIKRSKQAPRASSFSPPPTTLNKLQDSSRELSRIHAARSCVNPDDAHRASSLRRIRSVADYFLFFLLALFRRLFSFVALRRWYKHKVELNSATVHICACKPGFSLRWSMSRLNYRSPAFADRREIVRSLFSMPFPYLCLRSIFVVSHLLGHGSP